MTATPPFDPPYKFLDASSGDGRWMELRADGTQIGTAAPPTALHHAPGAAQNARASAPAASRKPAASGTVLNVPFAEKDEAKQLGARWDAAKRKWYVPNGVDLAAFSRWTGGKAD